MPKRRSSQSRQRVQIVSLAIFAAFTILIVSAALAHVRIPMGSSFRSTSTATLPSTAGADGATPSATVAKPQRLRVAIVGDGITMANSTDFQAGQYGDQSWVNYLGESVEVVGGYVRSGVTTTRLAQNTTKVDADVLIILAGANDIQQDVPLATSAANMKQIVQATGITRVLISATTPVNSKPGTTASYNEQLRQLAQTNGWSYVDAPAGVRNGNVYAAGMSNSGGIQPNAAAARIIGEAIAAALAAMS